MDLDLNGLSDDDLAYVAQTGKIPMRNKESAIGGTDASTVNTPDTGTPSTSKSMSASASTFANPSDKVGADNVRSVTRPSVQQLTSGDFSMPIEDLTDAELSLIASEDDHAKSRAIRDIHMERRNAGTEGFVQPVIERADDKARRDLMDRAQYVVDNSDEDDPAEKKDREYAQKYIDWLGTNADKYAGLDEETKAGFAKNIGGLYDKRKNERGTIEKVWDSVVRGHNQNAVMVSQGARMFKPGGLTQEDIDELRGLQTVSEQIETANPRAVGSIKDIGGVGDALMFALESTGENLERGLIAGAGSAIGAGVAGALGAGTAMTTAGGILGGSAATMLQNTGEAVNDQLEESVPFSRSLTLAQGGLYSVFDGAFGTGPLVGKAFSKMVKSASKESVKSGIGAWARNVVTDASIKNALLDIGKASVMEGVTEAAQSGLIGRGRRYLQTGSMLKQGETTKDAWIMAADEFFGGLSSALLMGGFSRGMNAANARHVIGTNERIVGALSEDEAYKNLTPEMKLVVGRRIANDALLETYNNTVLTEDQRMMLIASNATIDRYLEKQIGEGDRSAEAAQAFLDVGRAGFAVEDFNDTVEMAKSDGAVSEIDNESMRDNEAYVSNVDGSHAGVRNTDLKTGISIDTVTDNEDNPIAFFVNNRPGMKAPFGSRMKFDTLEEAVKFANDLSIYNRARLNKIEAKANVIKSVFDKMYAGRGVNLAIFDTPNGILDADVRQRALEEDPRSPGFYNASDNTVYMFIDNVRSIGGLFTVLGHERAHKDIADYIKKCDKYNGSVSEGRKDLFKEGNVRGAKELAESEEAAGRPYREGEIEAGEEILAERASIEQIAAALRSMDRGVVMRSAVRAIDAVKKMMGRSLGMSANVITDEDVRKELDFLWNRGMIGDGESSGFALYTPGDAPGAGSSGKQYTVQGDVLENTESEAEAVGMSAEEARAAVDAENNERARKQRENADPTAELLNDRGREPGMPVDRDEGGANSVSVAPTEAVDTDVVNADADVAPVSETEQKDEATPVEVAESTDSETPSEMANNGPTSAPQETAVIERDQAEKPAEGAREAENDDGDAYSVSVADDDAGTASESTEKVADSGENSSETEKHDSAAEETKADTEKSEPEKAEKPTKNKKQAKEIKRTTGDYLAELDGLSESDAERDIKERGLENDESAKTALILHNRASDHLLANIRWGRDAKRDTSVGREDKDADAEKPITAAQALLICERVSKEGYVYYPNESNGDNKELGGYWDYCSPYMARKIQEACVAWFRDHRRKDGNGIDNKRFVAAFDKILETIIGPEGNSVRNAISHRKIVSPLESDEMSRMYRGRIRDAFTPKGKKAGSAEDYIAHNPSVENDPTDLCFGPFYDFVFNVYPGIGAKKSDLYGKFDIPSRRSNAYELYMGLPEEIRTIMCKPGKPTDQDNWDVNIEEISSAIGGRYSGGIDGYELFLSDLVRSYEKYKDWVACRIGSEIAMDEENARRAAEEGSKEVAAYRAELEARGKEYDAIGDEEIARIQEYMGDNLPRLASNIEVGKTYRVAGYNVNVVDMYGIGMELEIEGVRFVVDYFYTDVYNTVVNEVERKAKAIYERKKAETQAEAQSETKETENGRDQDVREEGPETVGGREEGRDDVRADVQETEGRGEGEERGEGESEERGEGRENLALESVTAEELKAEEEKRKQKQEIEKRLAEPLKGGAVESGQTLLDLGGAEVEDLFNRTQTEAAAKEGKSENGVEESDKQETEPAEQSMTPVEAYRVLRMDAAKSDAELNRLATAWEKNAKSRPEFAKMAQAARVLLADRAKKGKTDPRSDVAFDYKQNGVDKETVPSEASAESDNATTGAENARTTSKADDEKVSITPKSTESGNNTPTEEGFRAWAVEKDTGEPLVFANDADRKHSREMFDGLVKKGLVDGKTGQTLMRWKRSNDLTQKAKDEGWIRIENGNLYEQTFFTNRAPGDESHLLSWYEPVSDENIKRIASRLDRENIDWSRYKSFVDETSEQFVRAESRFSPGQRNGVSNIYGRLTSLLGSPRAASEFLARADIDGIKYPADSYGGKSVKNGDEAGWNYVSFRDDNITVDHKWVNGEQRFKRSNREEMELATADNPNVAFANKEGLLAKTGYEKLFDSIDDARMMESGAAIANDPVRFNRVIDAALAGRAMTSLDFASLIVGYRNGLLRLAGVREGMDATNGKDRALEEQTADAALTRIMDAVRKAGNTAGRALQMLKVGIGLDTARDTYYYLVSEVKAIKAKQGLDTNLTAEEEKMLRNQVAVLEKKNEELNKAIEEERKRAEDAESKLAAAVMNGKSAEMGVFRLDENARRSIKSSLVNHTYSDDGIRAMLRAKTLFGTKDVRFKAGEEGRAGGTSNADRYNEEMRDIIYQVLSDFKGDVQSVEKVFRENFGEEGVAMVARFKAEELGKNEAEVATNVEQKVRENGDNFKKREQDKSKTDPKKLLKNGKTVEGMRDALGKLRQKTVERISDFADNPENKRKALGRYLRKYNEFLIAENPSLSNEEIFDRMVEEAKRLDPDGNYDAAQMMYVLTGKHGFDIATREAMAKRLEDLKAAIMLAKSGHLVEAAKKAGVAYESESDKLAQHVEHLQEILDRNTRRLNEILAAPSSEDAAVVSEIESLKRDIADVLDAIKEQRRELAAIERKRKYAAFLEKRLADKRAELDEVISGRDPMREEALRKRLDAEIAETRDELTSVRRETNLLRSLQAQIDEINERIANNDFEPHPPRSRTPLSERSVRVQQLMIERDAARKRFASERARYQYRKLSKPVKFWKDFWEIMGESKAIIGSLDLSSMFRQGGQLTFAHPILFSHNFRKTLDAFRNESNASRLMAEIMMRPNADYYKKAGVEFTDYGDMAENADDRFILNHYRKITKNKFIKAGVQASERAFAMFLNLMRADVFDAMVSGSTYGSASRMTDSQLKAIGGFINVASQRGMIDKGDWLGKMIPGLNHVLWSPRNVISRFQFITNLFRLASPWANPYGDKTLRALFAKEIGRYLLGVSAMIAFTKMLADLFRPDDEPPDDIEFNPLSSQFMRVKFGNTRVDMMSGLAQVVTFGTRFWLGMNKNARGEFHDTNRPELVGRFLRSKLSPLASFVWDFSGQETFERQDIVWSKPFVSNKEEKSGYRHFVEQFIPLAITDILEQIQYTGYARTAVTSLYTILGAGVQAYDPYTYKQMSGDFHAFKRQYDDMKDAEERARFVAKHPMLKRIGQIESAIKRVNYARRIMNNVKKANPNADLTYHENQVERNKKIAVNVMMGAPDPYNVD